MNKVGAAAVLILLVLDSSFALAPAFAQTSNTALVTVQVKDQFGVFYDGVVVTVVAAVGNVTETGTTSNGIYITPPMPYDSNYTVIVSTSTASKNSTFYLYNSNAFVSFTLVRPETPQVLLSSVSFNPQAGVPGKSVSASLTLATQNSASAYYVTMSMKATSPIGISGSGSLLYFGTVAGNASVSKGVVFSIGPTAAQANYVVDYTINYTDTSGVSYHTSGSLYVPVVIAPLIPKLTFGTFVLAPSPLKPGVSSTLALNVTNIGGDSAYNATISLTGGVFGNGTLSNYLGSLTPSSAVATTFFVSVPNSTLSGNYPFGMSLAYQDISGNTYTTQTNFSLSVKALTPPNVVLTGTILSPPVLSPGAQGTMTLFLKNVGQSDATDITINIYGGEGLLAQSYFGLGSLAAGASATQVVGLYLSSKLKPGSYLLSINATFQAPSGEVYKSSSPLQTNVYVAHSLFSATTILLGIAIVAAAVIAYAFLRKYKIL